MPSALVIGSGPAAAAATMALTAHSDWRVTVIDVGAELEDDKLASRERMSSLPPVLWSASDVANISAPPAPSATSGLPEKRAYGSAYAFADHGQLAPLSAALGVHRELISGAYGGFSTVWGAQTLPFPRPTFREWPFAASDMDAHYAAVLAEMPFAATLDDLVETLPLHGAPGRLPALSPRAEAILCRYELYRTRIRAMGIDLGRSRLAMNGAACVNAGLCMTGCPYSLIYSAAHTFDRLRARGRVEYLPGLVALRVEEDPDSVVVTCRTGDGGGRRLRADRVFVACGAVGSTRLLLASARRFGEWVPMLESAQFVAPFLSRRSTGNPVTQPNHTLAQLSAVIRLRDSVDVAHLQIYTYDPAFLGALPPVIRRPWAGAARAALLGRLSVGLGYLPSSESAGLRVRLAPGEGRMGNLEVTPASETVRPPTALRAVLGTLTRAAAALDLWPVLPRVELAAPGKSYHWGGSFPHGAQARDRLTSDRTGRVAPWRRVHLVDGAVLPGIAATTFTLTIMANAHRIASEVARLGEAAP